MISVKNIMFTKINKKYANKKIDFRLEKSMFYDDLKLLIFLTNKKNCSIIR